MIGRYLTLPNSTSVLREVSFNITSFVSKHHLFIKNMFHRTGPENLISYSKK
nr:MAG TPA: hypothetical protein [Caudoviricetes sp.]